MSPMVSGKQATLAFLPCLMGTQLLWSHQRAELEKDYPCFGADFSRAETIADMAASVLKHTEGPLIPIGLSLGGYVAFEIWRQAPQRVAAMVLCNTSSRPDHEQQTKDRRELMARVRESWNINMLVRAVLPMLLHSTKVADDHLRNVVFEMAETLGKDVFFREQEAIIARVDSRPDLPQITCPALVISGDDDRITPQSVHEEMANLLPNSNLQVLTACGHLSAIEQPQVVSKLIASFLKTLA